MKKNDIRGETLKRARLQAGLSQKELADKVGVTQTYISTWETERRVPSEEHFNKLQKVVDLDIDSEVGPSPIGAWLVKARNKKGLSAIELAEKAGLTFPTIYNIESGRSPNPHQSTVEKLEKALGEVVPEDTSQEAKSEATIEGIGQLVDFDPYAEEYLPKQPGIYVLYDISERPIYVGEGESIKKRILDHGEKFWFKPPIVEKGSFLVIKEKALREQMEKVLIKFLKSNAVLNKQHVER